MNNKDALIIQKDKKNFTTKSFIDNDIQNIKIKNHMDAGCEIFVPSQEIYSGASGPVTLPLVLYERVLACKRYKKILIIATGSLQSVQLANQKLGIPGIAHAISLEVE